MADQRDRRTRHRHRSYRAAGGHLESSRRDLGRHHVASVYVGGVLKTTTLVGGTMPNSTGALSIGGNGVWSEWFQGIIDEVRVYNRALTANQLATIRDTPVNP
jgi:Concanavalin A-like lectin/glucanases superfamily